MHCSNCGKQLEEESKFCQHCGAKVEEEAESTVRPVDKEILEHLEFLGYEIEKREIDDNSQATIAKHENKSNLIMNAGTTGTSFISLYRLDPEKVKKNRLDALEMLNRMNNNSAFVKFSMPDTMQNLACCAFFDGKYNKKEFTDFIETYEADIRARLGEENYLKELD